MSDEGPVMGPEQRGRAGQIDPRSTPLGEEPTEGSKLRIPIQSDHSFRSNPITHSDPIRSPWHGGCVALA
jgi:hypothetical protein